MREIPDSGFAGDNGEASSQVVAAMQVAGDPTRFHEVLSVVQDARVLVPVVAVLGEVEYDDAGLAHDKTSDMAAVLLTGADGRTALLAFTGTAALAAWNPEARPVPVELAKAALAALQQGAAAVVLDLAGPGTFAIEGEPLEHLARGHRLVRHEGGWAWALPQP